MQITINPKTRVFLYIVTLVGTPLIAYLRIISVIGDAEVALWSAEVSVVNLIAALNVNK